MKESPAANAEASGINEQAKKSEQVPEDDKNHEMILDLRSMLASILETEVPRQFEAHWPSLVSSLSQAISDSERRRAQDSDVSYLILYAC